MTRHRQPRSVLDKSEPDSTKAARQPPAATIQWKQVVTARFAGALPAPQFGGGDVKRIRAKLGLSQAVFGAALNVSPDTVRAWEQGKKNPGGPAERLLELAEKHPAMIRAVVQPKSETKGD